MTNLISKILCGVAAAVALAGLAGCSDGAFSTTDPEDQEVGLPCSVTLKVELPQQTPVAVSRATEAVENRIENIALFFFPDVSERPVVWYEAFATPWVPSSNSNPKQITIALDDQQGLTSGRWWVYAVANLGKTQGGTTLERLRAMNRTQFLNYCTNAAPALDIVATSVLMSGTYTSTSPAPEADGSIVLTAGANQLAGSIMLKRVMAKHTLTFVNGTGVTFIPSSFTVYNVSTSETLMERDGWTSDGTTASASGTYAGANMQRAGVQGSLVDLNGVVSSQLVNNSYTIEFYTRENVQHPKTTTPAADWTNYYNREAATTDERNKVDRRRFTYAPDDATYIVVRGHYRGPGETNQTTGETPQADGDVEYTIHLGDFGSTTNAKNDNFTIRRNFHYTYTITINGVKNIIAEAKATDGNADGQQPGAEGTLMSPTDNMVHLDAHYETVLLKIDKGRLTDYAYSISTPYTRKTILRGSHQTQQDLPTAFVTDDDYRWVEFAKPYTVNGTFNPNEPFESYSTLKRADYASGAGETSDTRKLYYLPKLLDYLGDAALTAQTNDHFVVEGNYIYVVAYVDEYYYTNRPDGGGEARLSEFVNTADRTMGMATNTWISADNHSIYSENPVFLISQRSIKSGFSLEVPNPLGVETYEETAPQLITVGRTDQSDPDTSDDEQWGWANFYQHFDAHPSGTSTVTRYTRWSDLIDEHRFGWVPGATEYVFQENSNNKPLYGLYQAISRNRDNDGNGVIDADEVRWFLPSHTQCLALWYVNNSLPVEAQFKKPEHGRYLTSSNGGARVWWIDEGTAFGLWKGWENAANVRAVRALGRGFYNRRTTLASRWDQRNRIITVTNLSSEAMRVGRLIGNLAAHTRGAEEDKLPEAFQIAERDYVSNGVNSFDGNTVATSPTIGFDYYEAADESDKGQWRVPNEKELGLMFQYLGDGLSDYTVARSYYKAGQPYYYVQQNTPRFITTANKSNGFKVRLVRDVPPIAVPDYDNDYLDGGSAFGQ